MKLSHLIFAAFISSALGCAPSTQLPNKERLNKYPAMIQVSAQRQAQAEREWRRLLETYGTPPVQPDFREYWL